MGVGSTPCFIRGIDPRPRKVTGIFFGDAWGGIQKYVILTEQVDSVFRRVLKATI